MAKNLLSNTSYRNLDVDAYDLDKFTDAYEESADIHNEGPDEGLIKQLLQSNKNVEALKAALLNPPLKTKKQSVKAKATTIVGKVLSSFKSVEIPEALSLLTPEEIHLLLKYIYKTMELLPEGQQSCALLLMWHSQVFAISGHGGIIRVLCDRNRL